MDNLELDFLKALNEFTTPSDTGFTKLNPIEKLITLSKKYGNDWVAWESETLFLAIDKDFCPGFSTDINQSQRDMVNALKTMCATDDFWDDTHIYEKCCLALDSQHVIFQIEQPLSPAQCLLGLEVADFIRKDSYDEDVCEYIAQCCRTRGIVYLPGKLSVAQDMLDKMKNDIELKNTVKHIWNKVMLPQAESNLGILNIEDIEFSEDDATDTQIVKMYIIVEYVRNILQEVTL